MPLQRELRLRMASATVILLTLVFVAYANSLHNGFVWDDHEQLVMNPAVQPRAPLSPLFLSDVRFSHLGLGAQTHTYTGPCKWPAIGRFQISLASAQARFTWAVSYWQPQGFSVFFLFLNC